MKMSDGAAVRGRVQILVEQLIYVVFIIQTLITNLISYIHGTLLLIWISIRNVRIFEFHNLYVMNESLMYMWLNYHQQAVLYTVTQTQPKYITILINIEFTSINFNSLKLRILSNSNNTTTLS